MDPSIEQLIRYLVAHLKCAACQHTYNPEDLDIIDQGSSLLVLLMTCQHCQAQGLIVALVQEQKPEPQRATQERERSEVQPITADDVLEIHRFLESFDGDCVSLLRDSSQHGE